MNIFKESRFIFDGPEELKGKPAASPEVQKAPEKEGFFAKMMRKMKEVMSSTATAGIAPDKKPEAKPSDPAAVMPKDSVLTIPAPGAKAPEAQSKAPKTPEAVKEASTEALAGVAASAELAKGPKTTPEAVTEKVHEDTTKSLEDLQGQMAPGENVRKLERIASLTGFKSKGEDYYFDTPPGEYRKDLKAEVLKFFVEKSRDWEGVKGLVEDIPEEKMAIMHFFAAAAANSMVTKITTEIEGRQTFYNKWKLGAGKDQDVRIKIEGTRKTEFKVVFPKAFEDAKAADEAAEVKKAEEEKVAASPNGRKVDQLIASPIGKILAWIGYKDPETGLPDRKKYEAIINGTDWFGAFIVGLFGYTEFAGEFYESAKEMLPPAAQKSLGAIEQRARSSKFSAEEWRKTDDYKEVMQADAKAGLDGAIEEVDDTEFGAYLTGDKVVPSHGIKLKVDYKRADVVDDYKIIAKKGAKIVIPAGAKLTLGGEDMGNKDKETTVKIEKEGQEFIPTGIIPKGTFFANIEFKKVEVASGDAKK
ncbi:hypothetical protein HN709_02925 [Candidatus Peregrinibacteria bacterium]|jgi:hypothetical protein|nr:hypothetical protein [Candidatus Peregrinibacteria bacterium]MBT7736617.1 hypothetical protein [Candidatus Peregrinibacteria bacterium]